jgi:hypothetical protein
MFELNLIKEKALARQRRRVIFLSVMSVVLLSGLLSMFVGGLIYQEFMAVNKLDDEIADTRRIVAEEDMQIATTTPRLIARRTALINAYNESFTVQDERPAFTPILIDIYEQRPLAEFWYNQVTVSRPGRRTTPGQRGTGHEEAETLMGARSVLATGYVQILQSDVLTETDLESVAARMELMRPLVGDAEYVIDTGSLDDARTRVDEAEMRRYAAFRMTTSARPARASSLFGDRR